MPAPPTTGQIRRLTQQEADLICAKHDRLWAAKPGGARAVFSWMDLTGLDFRGRMLNDADFTGAILDNAKFAKARLDHAIFFGADVQNADFAEASMRRADLRGACMRNCDMSGADLFEADLREGVIASADRTRGLRILEPVKRAGQAQGANLTGANLERSKLSGVVAISTALGVEAVLGVSSKEQVVRSRAGSHTKADYDALWALEGGSPQVNGFHVLSPEGAERPLSDVPTSHRRRTKLKRKFKQELLEEVTAKATALLADAQKANPYMPEVMVLPLVGGLTPASASA